MFDLDQEIIEVVDDETGDTYFYQIGFDAEVEETTYISLRNLILEGMDL